MRFLLRCNGFNNSFAVSFHSFCPSFFCFPFILFLFPFFLVGLEYCTLKSLEHFSFNSVRWGGSWYFRPSLRGGLANFTPIEGMGHLISEPKFKIPTPPPPFPSASFWQVPYQSRCSSWKPAIKARIAWDLSTLLSIKQGDKRKRCHLKSDFR